MRTVQVLSIVAVISGLMLGPWALQSSQAASPPFSWSDIPFVFVGSAIGVLFVVGFQVLMGKQGPARVASWFFGIIGIHVASSGVSAAVVAALRDDVGPGALLMVSVGTGTIMGALLAGMAYRAKFAA